MRKKKTAAEFDEEQRRIAAKQKRYKAKKRAAQKHARRRVAGFLKAIICEMSKPPKTGAHRIGDWQSSMSPEQIRQRLFRREQDTLNPELLKRLRAWEKRTFGRASSDADQIYVIRKILTAKKHARKVGRPPARRKK